jgi:hypothetical protein
MTLTCRKQSEKAEGRQGKAKQGEKMTLTTRKNNGKTEGRMNRHGSRNDAWEWAMNDERWASCIMQGSSRQGAVLSGKAV